MLHVLSYLSITSSSQSLLFVIVASPCVQIVLTFLYDTCRFHIFHVPTCPACPSPLSSSSPLSLNLAFLVPVPLCFLSVSVLSFPRAPCFHLPPVFGSLRLMAFRAFGAPSLISPSYIILPPCPRTFGQVYAQLRNVFSL